MHGMKSTSCLFHMFLDQSPSWTDGAEMGRASRAQSHSFTDIPTLAPSLSGTCEREADVGSERLLGRSELQGSLQPSQVYKSLTGPWGSGGQESCTLEAHRKR